MDFPKFGDAELASVISYHQRITAASFEPGTPATPQSDKARNAIRLLNSGSFDCHTRQTATLVEILLGEPISRYVNAHGATGPQLLSGTMVAARMAVSGVTAGLTYLVLNTNKDGSAHVAAADGSRAGPLHPTHYVRATDEQIAAFFHERNGGPAQVPQTEGTPVEDEEMIPW